MTQAVRTKIPPRMTTQLRRLVADEIAKTKAYNVPALCVRLGLAPGDDDEAFRSKARYAETRLAEVTGETVLSVARQLLEDADNFEMSELVFKIEERDASEVTPLTRARLLTLFDHTPFATLADELDIVRQVWPIAEMASVSPPEWGKSITLEDDIFQHTVRNHDWSGKELLEHLGVRTSSNAQLFKFLAATVDPMIRRPHEQESLALEINEILKHDGYALQVIRKLSGSPVYAVRPLTTGAPSDVGISAALKAFNADDVHPRWQAALESRETDPQRAITLARTLLEDVCKWILTEAKTPFDDTLDLPGLYKLLAKTLNLAPDDHTEQLFKQILSGCNSVVTGLGALRNKLGDAHSIGPVRGRPAPRHAELAVNLAGAMATFLTATWEARRAKA